MHRIVLISIILFCTGCSGSQSAALTPLARTERTQSPSPTASVSITASTIFPTATEGAAAYPGPFPTIAQGPYPPPAQTETARSNEEYWLTQTALPSVNPEHTSTITPGPTFTPTAPLPVLRLSCSTEGKATTCTDHLLRIRFEYPAEWGEIEPMISHGGYAGYAYGYSFTNREVVDEINVGAGGRSSDFSEGRGAFITDYRGMPGQLDCSTEIYQPGLCQAIAPQVLLTYEFPEARWVCEPGPGTRFKPIAIIKINLPQNKIINGFIFVSQFLSPTMQQELDRIINPLHGSPSGCEEPRMAQFDAKVHEIMGLIQSGNLDTESEKQLRWLMRLARSIKFID